MFAQSCTIVRQARRLSWWMEAISKVHPGYPLPTCASMCSNARKVSAKSGWISINLWLMMGRTVGSWLGLVTRTWWSCRERAMWMISGHFVEIWLGSTVSPFTQLISWSFPSKFWLIVPPLGSDFRLRQLRQYHTGHKHHHENGQLGYSGHIYKMRFSWKRYEWLC